MEGLKERVEEFRRTVDRALTTADYRLERGQDSLPLSGHNGVMQVLTAAQDLSEQWLGLLQTQEVVQVAAAQSVDPDPAFVQSLVDTVEQVLAVPEASELSAQTREVLGKAFTVALYQNPQMAELAYRRKEVETLQESVEAVRTMPSTGVTMVLGAFPSKLVPADRLVRLSELLAANFPPHVVEDDIYADIAQLVSELEPGTYLCVRERELNEFPFLMRHLEPVVDRVIEKTA